ncbi:unnamed protein product [Schistosoma rodhaini]|uniref:Uncharacterized protein n=1 Tax=Schistosoma rodhaini TaxID=6188 RepID=A0AA85GBU9_9TREM|nr:unnamed protein product [Schistosoma rodhaini]CAH8622332.1 unnamed protein product [Schistosoma rodhaini]
MYSVNIWVVVLYSCTLIIQNIFVSTFDITSYVALCNNTNLYQISVKNKTHTLWFLISASEYHPPSLVLIQTTEESIVSVNCSRFDSNDALDYRNSVFINNAIQSYGLILHRIIRYRDINGETIAPDTGKQTQTFLGSNLNWTVASFRNDSKDNQITIEYEARQSLDSHEKIDGVIKLSSPFIQLGLEVSKDNKVIQSTRPNAYLQFPAAYWIDPQNTRAQLVRLGTARPIDNRYVKTKSYHFGLPFALYGDRFDQIHDQSTENHVAVREQIINLGSPHSKHYYTNTNYSSWIFIAGIGDPDIIPSNDDDNDNNTSNKNSIISAFICGLLIIVGSIGSVFVIRRIQRRHYQRISELTSIGNNNNNSNNEAVNSYSPIVAQELSSINDNRIVEPYQYEKLVSQPNHELISNNYHTITNENDYLPNNNMSTMNWNNYPPPYKSITKDY